MDEASGNSRLNAENSCGRKRGYSQISHYCGTITKKATFVYI